MNHLTAAHAALIPAALRQSCPGCGGTGEQSTSHKYTCTDCDGRRWVPAPGAVELLRAVKTGKPAP